jgi:hypothetical protein
MCYQLVLDERSSWDDDYRPHLIPDDEVGEIPEGEPNAWKEQALLVAVSGYHIILEEGRDLSDSSGEGNEHNEEMDNCAPGSSIETILLQEFDAFLLRNGSAQGQGTVSGAQPGLPALFRRSDGLCQRGYSFWPIRICRELKIREDWPGMTAAPTVLASVEPATPWGPDQVNAVIEE